MELIRNQSLWDRLKEKGRYEENTAKRTIHKLLDALLYLHSIGIVHRDLKAENIFMRDCDDDTSIVLGKLIKKQFSFSKKSKM